MRTAFVLSIVLLTGCAAAPARPAPADPFERVNRTTYEFNQAVDRAFLKPLARGYDYFTPKPLRVGITNVLSNLAVPVVLINDLLQLKPVAAAHDLGRLLINSTFGLGGLFDPASGAGIRRNDEDFGQTFGYWGVPAGPYVLLPFFGPSSLRDAPAFAIEWVVDVRTGLDDQALENTLLGLTIVNKRAELLVAEKFVDEAYDPYAFVRNAWLQRREYLVTDGAAPAEEPLEDPLEDPLEEPLEESPEAPEAPGDDDPAPEPGTTETLPPPPA